MHEAAWAGGTSPADQPLQDMLVNKPTWFGSPELVTSDRRPISSHDSKPRPGQPIGCPKTKTNMAAPTGSHLQTARKEIGIRIKSTAASTGIKADNTDRGHMSTMGEITEIAFKEVRAACEAQDPEIVPRISRCSLVAHRRQE